MPSDSASLAETTTIRRLALTCKAKPEKQAKFDMLAWAFNSSASCSPLTTALICSLIVEWIDSGGKLASKSMTGKHKGINGYDFVTRHDGRKLYIKVVIDFDDDDDDGQYLAIVSSHPPH